jgi:alanyl-tRNA synthetase
MTAKEIRSSFIDFFRQQGHTYVSSSPVIPQDDPTLLFTNAGMNQFKDILLGKGNRLYSRAVNSQKCIRVSGKHNDLEEVGHDTYHHTFFEMLGNWSFGDYYKKEAIAWAWELLTEVWKLPKDKLYATVFRDDREAAELWKKMTDIDPKRILRFDEKSNFWEMGDTGPCGPCSEIHIDLGADHCDRPGIPHTCQVNGGCARFIELWNLVFIQFQRDETGNLNPLPARHVDTGAGFERLVAVLQHKKSNYETDLFQPIIHAIGKLVNQSFEESGDKVAFQVIADHIRMLVFSIADGGFPANDGRGYVMRRILRRAARYGRKLHMHEPFIYKLVDTVGEVLGDTFPEIKERSRHIQTVIQSEEDHFNRTLDRGLDIFEKIKTDLQKSKKVQIPGSEVFKLYDTYGFPADLTAILANEAGLKLDMTGFEQEMKSQQDRARKAAKFKMSDIPADAWIVVNEGGSTNFVGYSEDAIETHVLKYSIHDNKLNLVLKDTPFYAESGGQIGDHGKIVMEGFELRVLDTYKYGDEIIHVCELPDNFEFQSDRVLASIDSDTRRQTEKNHTATHLLHAALRRTLGPHVQQAGSLVEPDRLRFDFTHHTRLSAEEIIQIERLINERIQEDIPLQINQDTFEQAKKRGAMALFGEKYGEVVRTIQIDDFSLELCGGTHVRQTGQIGLLIIINESSISAGVRRIEALTGKAAVNYLQKIRGRFQELGELLNSTEDELTEKTQDLIMSRRKLEKELEKLNSQLLKSSLSDIISSGQIIKGINVISHQIPAVTIDQLKEIGDQIREHTDHTVALLGTRSEGKINFVCVVTDDLIKKKQLHAGELVRKVAQVAGGSGGGKPHMATAGAKDEEKFEQAMHKIKELI